VLFIKQILAELEKKTLQRIKSVPLAYIFKKASFDGNIFFVSKFVLIPRFDSEVLVESAADRFAEDLIGRSINSGKVINIADICSGSGCLGIAFCLRIMSILKKVKTDEERSIKLSVNLYFVDISKQALSVARKNFKNLIKNSPAINLLGFKIKARYINVDILKKEETTHKIKTNFFDYILYNPPYIEKHAIKGLSKEVQKEPILALDGGVDGLKFYRIISRLRGYLKSDVRKRFFIEIGYNQKEAIESICAPLREPVCFKKDLEGNIRLAII
jgi:release factor glutamine methyltransferase